MKNKQERHYVLAVMILITSLLMGCVGGGSEKSYNVLGTVVDGVGSGIDGVEIAVTGDKSSTVTTASGGKFELLNLTGTCTLTPSLFDFDFEPESVTVSKASSDVRFVGTAKPIEKYSLTVELGTGSGEYEAGATVAITANSPDKAGQAFAEWTSSGGGSFTDANAESTSFTMPKSDVTVTASYRVAEMQDYLSFDSTTGTITDYHKNGKHDNLEPMLDPVIPASINGKPVTVIGAYAFQHAQLTSVVIPEGVTTIEEWAFNNNLLTEVDIPSSVTFIGEYAFVANKLKSIVIPDGITHISKAAFWLNELTSITFPTSVTHIGNSAFETNKLETITIPSSILEIGSNAFSKNNLKALTIPPNVQKIGSAAFSNNTNLASIVIPNDIWIDNYGFYSSSLPIKQIEIGSGVSLGETLLGEDNYFKSVYDGAGGGAGVYIGTFKYELGAREWVKQ